jgi:hypothetical protein
MFEPDIFLQDTLRDNVEWKGINNVSIHEEAVGSEQGELDPWSSSVAAQSSSGTRWRS